MRELCTYQIGKLHGTGRPFLHWQTSVMREHAGVKVIIPGLAIIPLKRAGLIIQLQVRKDNQSSILIAQSGMKRNAKKTYFSIHSEVTKSHSFLLPIDCCRRTGQDRQNVKYKPTHPARYCFSHNRFSFQLI